VSPLFGGKKGGAEPSGPRSAAEREAARRERERPRAEREGRPLPEPPAPSDGTGHMAVDELWAAEPPAQAEPPYAPEPESTYTPEPESTYAPEPESTYAPEPGQAYAPEPEPTSAPEPPAAPEPAFAPEPPQPEPAPYAEQPPAPEPAEPQWFDAPPAEAEPAAPATARHDAVPSAPAEPEPHYEVPFEPVYEPEPVTVPPSGDAHDDDAGQDTAGWARVEQPSGVRRVRAPSVADLPRVAGARPTPPGPVRGPAGERRGRTRGVPRTHRGARRVIPVLLLAVLVAIGWFAYRVFQPGHGDGDAKQPVTVVIPQGATSGQIAEQLQKAGVIDSTFFFNIRSRLTGRRGDLKAGRFTLRKDMSYVAAIDALTQNPAAAPTVRVTIPEGRSISEESPLIRAAGLTGSYAKAAGRNPRTVKGMRAYGVPKGTRTLEGFLFPATYELKRGAKTATASALVAEQLQAFRDAYNKLDRRAARRKNLTDYDVLIIASMIEREAQVDKDRRLISAVIYNRLKQHIPLGIDATLRYHLKNWSRPLRQSELQQDSAFNTRTRQGLPPTPIGSPGLASIKAALSPAKASYLYYVVKPCGNGAHAFSSTDAQFQKDVAAYNRKRAQLGGKDPSHC
jgi:uncharacterized YceG family protein